MGPDLNNLTGQNAVSLCLCRSQEAMGLFGVYWGGGGSYGIVNFKLALSALFMGAWW